MSMIGPVQSHCHEGSPVDKRSLRWEGFVADGCSCVTCCQRIVFITGDSTAPSMLSASSLHAIHLLIHLSTILIIVTLSIHQSLLHSFTRGSKPTFSTNPSQLNFSSLLIGLLS